MILLLLLLQPMAPAKRFVVCRVGNIFVWLHGSKLLRKISQHELLKGDITFLAGGAAQEPQQQCNSALIIPIYLRNHCNQHASISAAAAAATFTGGGVGGEWAAPRA